ncbi:hypothetical protein B1T49_25965 [Mycobacterium persicum]|nr:hypothetical protein B1T49_25965 [Mycobacterium persicum]
MRAQPRRDAQVVQVGGEVGGSSIAVIARQMDMIRDQFIAEVFDTMKNEIQGLDYDSRMLDMWEASITELGLVGGSLLVPTDEREARLWFSVWEDRAGDPSRLRAAFESAGIRARLACGQTADGLRGFRASLKQAELVKAVVHAGGARRGARVVCYDDVAPIALIAGDVDALRRYVAEVLGELSVDEERNEWLRETLREFLVRNRSYVATAEAMLLHRNTIQYRVAQAMELCGGSFDDPDAAFRVQVALEIRRWMAPAVLGAP